jgi:hypothetical protein
MTDHIPGAKKMVPDWLDGFPPPDWRRGDCERKSKEKRLVNP